MTTTTIRYPVLSENSYKFARVHPPGFGPGEPYYEPDHLRHRPGDTFEIGGKPRDPEDPGPYGTRGWFQDRRVGRHRRGELPDPIESEEPGPDGRRRFWFTPDDDNVDRCEAETRPLPGFTPLQEDAWKRWLVDSAPLAAAHTLDRRTAIDRECGRTIALVVRLVQWIVAVLRGPASEVEECSSSQDKEAEPTRAVRHRGHRPSAPPSPGPRTGDGHRNAWELRFDAQRPVTGGGVL